MTQKNIRSVLLACGMISFPIIPLEALFDAWNAAQQYKAGDAEGAKKCLHQMLVNDYSDWRALFNIGTIALNEQKPADAVAHFEQVLALNPGHALTAERLAAARKQLEQKKQEEKQEQEKKEKEDQQQQENKKSDEQKRSDKQKNPDQKKQSDQEKSDRDRENKKEQNKSEQSKKESSAEQKKQEEKEQGGSKQQEEKSKEVAEQNDQKEQPEKQGQQKKEQFSVQQQQLLKQIDDLDKEAQQELVRAALKGEKQQKGVYVQNNSW